MAYRHHLIPEAKIFCDGSCPPPCASIAQLIRGAWSHTSCGSTRQFGFPLKATRRNHPCESAAKCGKGLGAVEPKDECAKSSPLFFSSFIQTNAYAALPRVICARARPKRLEILRHSPGIRQSNS